MSKSRHRTRLHSARARDIIHYFDFATLDILREEAKKLLAAYYADARRRRRLSQRHFRWRCYHRAADA